MKKLAFILLAVGLPLAVTGLANPSGATINGQNLLNARIT
jgi:hypothetical protein